MEHIKPIIDIPKDTHSILYYEVNERIVVLIGEVTVYKNKLQWLVRGDYEEIAKEHGIFGKKPQAWSELCLI